MKDEAAVDPTPDLDSAVRAFGAFLELTQRESRVVALHDCDADGVAAGVDWQRGMERLGYGSLARVIPNRVRNVWTADNRGLVEEARPERLFVMDLGSRPEPVVSGVPTCFIDHHRPGGCPPGDTLISAYRWNAIPNSSLMVWELFGSVTEVGDLDWVAVIGTFSDLGEHAPFPLMEEAKARYRAKYLREATTLINAARRASEYIPEVAARALLAASSPRDLAESSSEDVERLCLAREEVRAALAEAKNAAPKFAGRVALVRIDTPCQVHPLIAQIWRSRLPKYIVFVANEGFMPGRVNFSARSGPDVSVLDFLQGLKEADEEMDFGHGHDQASGGSLPVEQWNRLLERIGFGAEMFADGP